MRIASIADYWTKKILEWPDDAPIGCIPMVDLEYPIELHDAHNDYPLCSERIVPPDTKFNKEFRKLHGITHIDKTEKLVPNLNNKKKYIAHYRYIKFCLQQGMKITRVYSVLGFNQSAWLKDFIDFCVNKRAEATKASNKVLSDFYKLLMNASYGKTMENIEKRIDIVLCALNKKLAKYTEKI